ncbi:M23 family metallopeptidase [Rhodocytophaga aerolata]|uniref:M23 family metallopeptidase n=1 Tax=Rhodocytophaga aerolata TaxID=455078 RepID=A0ABT8R8C9_9BACT|nr:M23 family metallopeptidase [Rhodocytophaga aerolata]MDO1448355.1 M23 family metallopeptidase [Rhodocytophaga aerolata]
MARIKYYYDTETCKYERIKTKTSDVVLNLLGFFAVAFLLAIIIVPFYSSYFKSSREAELQKENEEMHFYYDMLNKEMKRVNQMIAALQDRDDNVYRVIFEAEPISSAVRTAGVGGSERYKDLLEKGLDQEEMIVEAFNKIDKLKKQMYVQTKSYDEILKFAKNKAHMWASIPAVQPIPNKELKRLASGYGMRIHPIYKVKRMHTGVDFSAPRGTPIYASGDGVVTVVRKNFGGYGNEVQVDHGYGYVTLYAHMEKFNVRQGQKVKRGECIGYVGSTGSSTAPHLHYEVIHNGNKVNPVHFFFNELTPDEYEKMLEIASVENQSMS